MKKMFLLVLATILSISALTQRGNVELGIKGGINLSDYSENVNTSGFRTGFHIGGLAHIHTNNRKLAIQPELVFSTQGADFNDGTQQVDYINIPFLIQYLGRGGLRLETGPQVGALVSAKFKENDGDEYSIKNAFKQSDFGWAFGIGFISNSGLGLDARYNLGLSDITKGRGDVKNRVWQFGLFYQFRR
ncbi:MAG TPA: porin family protein [Flavisolibacter sp.]|nr:porin family protein [Flavisolibacter sp.]